jgi:hypothetical protein
MGDVDKEQIELLETRSRISEVKMTPGGTDSRLGTAKGRIWKTEGRCNNRNYPK